MATATLVFFGLIIHSYSYATKVSLNNVLFNGDYELVDLSHPFDNETVYWPSNKKFEFTKKAEGFVGDDHHWYAANEFAAAEHGGTHIDAPFHFYTNGKHVGDLPIENLILPLIIIDISSKVNDNPDFVLFKNDLDYFINDNMGKPCVIIFKFGWSKFYNNVTKYLGKNDQSLNFPGLSAEVAEWIVTYKNVVGIGVDVASVDPGSSEDFPVHQILSKAGVYNMENVKLSRHVPEYGCTAVVMPMKITEGTGAPLRLVAICPKQNWPNKF